MHWGNCYLYALRQWWRHGGHVVVRRSHWGWWPHMAWSPNLKEFYDFVPVAEYRKRWFPPPVFRGRVRVSMPSCDG